jgi:hypothetical protein
MPFVTVFESEKPAGLSATVAPLLTANAVPVPKASAISAMDAAISRLT